MTATSKTMSEHRAGPRVADESPEDWFHRIASDYVEAQVLFHLGRAGVLSLLDRRGPLTPEAIAAELGLVVQPLESLLEFVVGVDRLLTFDVEGCYGLTTWGRSVLDRFADRAGPEREFNLFDLRVGSYGPVWTELGGMLDGSRVYGEDFQRSSPEADRAVYKVGAQVADALVELLDGLEVEAMVEVGVISGVLGRAAAQRPDIAAVGLDRSDRSLRRGREHAQTDDIAWLKGDLFAPEQWVDQLPDTPRGVLFSIHFHELIARGQDAVSAALAVLAAKRPGWYVVALEHPMAEPEASEMLPLTLRRYQHANAIIHHLIGNGRVLTDAGWRGVLEQAGCSDVRSLPLPFLAYRAFVGQLK